MDMEIIQKANKEIFELAVAAYDRGAGCDEYIELHKPGEFFMESMQEDGMVTSFLIHTIKFSVRIYSEIILSDTDQDTGTWQRIYTINNESNKYKSKPYMIKTSELIEMLK